MKNVTLRNLLGGFLGGIAGILSSGYLSPALLPVGVFLGVVAGWHCHDLCALGRESRAVSTQVALKCAKSFRQSVETVARVCHLPTGIGVILGRAAFATGRATLLAAHLPVRLCRWLSEHPTNRATAIRLGAFLLFALGIPAAGFYLEVHWLGLEPGNGSLAVPLLLSSFGGSLVCLVHHVASPNEELSLMGQYYRDWSVIARRGVAVFALQVIAQNVRFAVGTAVFLAVAVPWATGTMLLSGTAVVGISAACAFHRAAKRGGHRVCLGVTLAVTAATWLAFRGTFADPRALWLSALSAGVASGILSEIARLTLAAVFEGTVFGRKIIAADEPEDMLLDSSSGFVFWFAMQSRLARIFRAACFGFPVASPARTLT